ncbi:MAG: glycosyltransferase [Rhodothermales bacterium]
MPDKKEIDVSVVIVNYNVQEFLEQAIRSVEKARSGLQLEIFVVDNDSSDGSVEMVRTRFPKAHLISNKENTGFSKANNQAIRLASGKYLLILNPDTIIQEDTLVSMVKFMDAHPEAGALGCKILNADGSFAPESRRSFPTPSVAFYRITGLSKLFPNSARFGRYNLSYLSPDETCEVDALSGCCMFVRKDALYQDFDQKENQQQESSSKNNGEHAHNGAGLFDEDFFMYGEDLDWCFRIQEAGWKIYYSPETQIIHYKGESTKKGDLRYVLLFYGAMLRFAEKHFKKRHSWFFRLFLRCGIIARGSLHVISNWVKRRQTFLIDVIASFVVVSGAGLIRFVWGDLPFPTPYLGVIAPLYALTMATCISLQRGYQSRQYTRLIPVLLGNAGAILFIAAVSFFAKGIAFSRIALLMSFILSSALLFSIRLLYTHKKRPAHLLRRALIVGDQEEAGQLQLSLSERPRPLLTLAGYVSDITPDDTAKDEAKHSPVPWLGSLRHLRDIVRLQKIDDVVFSSSRLPNRTIFSLIQKLKNMPVEFKILSAGQEHLIGQARIDDLNAPPFIDAEKAFGQPRSTLQRRAFEVTLVTLGLLLHPFLRVLSKVAGPKSLPGLLSVKTKLLPKVLQGSLSLVGYRREEHTLIPKSWHLKPGIFTITDTLPAETKSADDLNRAYWLYYSNQSMALDFDIILRCIKQLKASSAVSS